MSPFPGNRVLRKQDSVRDERASIILNIYWLANENALPGIFICAQYPPDFDELLSTGSLRLELRAESEALESSRAVILSVLCGFLYANNDKDSIVRSMVYV